MFLLDGQILPGELPTDFNTIHTTTPSGTPRQQVPHMNAGNKRVACGVCRSKKYKCDGSLPGCAKRLGPQPVSLQPPKQLAPKSDAFPSSITQTHQQHFHQHPSPVSGTSIGYPELSSHRPINPASNQPSSASISTSSHNTKRRSITDDTTNFIISTPSSLPVAKRQKQTPALPLTPPFNTDAYISNHFHLPTPSFRDSLNPLTSLLDTISISFALEDESVKIRKRLRVEGHDMPAPRTIEANEIWIERLMLEKYFKCHSHFAYEVVHRRTFLETLHLQPAVLRYAMCALGGKLSVPQAPHAVIRSYFVKARALISDCIEECTLEHTQACYLLAICGSTLNHIGVSFAMLGLATSMAEYLKLHEDPNDDENLRTTLTWEEKEARRRCFWSIFFCDKMLCVMSGLPGFFPDERMDAITVQPVCDNSLFMSLEPLNLDLEPEPRPDSGFNRLNQIIAVGKRIQMAVGSKPAASFEALEQIRPELIAAEAALTDLFDALPPHLQKEPSELFLHEAFSTDEAAFARMVATATLEEHMSADPESPSQSLTRVGRGDAWDYNYVHALYHTLICLTHRPRLLLYAGLYRLPPHNSDEARLLQKTIEKTEKSAGFIVTLAERILRAGVAFSQHPALLFDAGGSATPSWESILSALSQTSVLLGLNDGAYDYNPNAPHANGVTPPPSIAPLHADASSHRPHPSPPQPTPTKTAEVDSHPFFGFALMISAMTLADLAALQRRLHPADSPALASYLIHCHGAIKLIKRYLASVTVFWHVSEDYLDGAAELLDGVVGDNVFPTPVSTTSQPFERAPSVATRAFRKSIVKGERFASYMEKGLEKAREEPRSPYWKDRIGSIRPEEVVGGGAGEAEFLASLGLDGDGNLGVGSSPTRTPDLDALIREVLG